MTPVTWTYPPEFLRTLEAVGIRPTARAAPALVRDAFNDMYRMELRRLRDRRRAGEVMADYLQRVVALRKKYWMLTLPLGAWEEICSMPQAGEGTVMDHE
jgi:hypothetical protein